MLADPKLEGRHVELAKAAGRYVLAPILGGCDTPMLVLGGFDTPVMVVRGCDTQALVLGLGLLSWGLSLAAAWFSEHCILLGGILSSSVANLLFLTSSNTELESNCKNSQT